MILAFTLLEVLINLLAIILIVDYELLLYIVYASIYSIILKSGINSSKIESKLCSESKP